MATTGNLDNKPVLVSEMRGYVGNISAHARGGNTLKATKTGAMVSVDDAYAGALLKLTAYGNSVQDGTPTPESPVEIKSVHAVSAVAAGVNLAKPNARASATNKGITSAIDDSGLITASGTSTGNGDIGVVFAAPILFKSGKTYVISLIGTDDRSSQLTFHFFDKYSGDYLSYRAMASSTHSIEWQVTNDYLVTSVFIRASTGTTVNISAYLQITESGGPTTYVSPVVSNTPLTLTDSDGNAHELRSLPDGTRDELVINADGSGTIIENVFHVQLDGTEGGYSANPLNGATRAKANVALSAYITDTVYNSAMKSSNQFKSGSSWSTLAHGQWYAQYDGIVFAITGDLTTAELKAYMAEHKPEFNVKVSGTPRTYHIPAINMPSLPDLVSNCWLSAIDADGAAIACEVGVEYRRDINKVISDLETAIADIVSA